LAPGHCAVSCSVDVQMRKRRYHLAKRHLGLEYEPAPVDDCNTLTHSYSCCILFIRLCRMPLLYNNNNNNNNNNTKFVKRRVDVAYWPTCWNINDEHDGDLCNVNVPVFLQHSTLGRCTFWQQLWASCLHLLAQRGVAVWTANNFDIHHVAVLSRPFSHQLLANSAFHRSRVGKWGPASTGKAKACIYIFHFVRA